MTALEKMAALHQQDEQALLDHIAKLEAGTVSVWVLTSEVNDYDQHGAYFEKVFKSKPTPEELLSAGVDGNIIDHVLSGGGRQSVEEHWYHLEQHFL